jgi:hypothetical protein
MQHPIHPTGKDGEHVDLDLVYYAALVCDVTYTEESFFLNITSGRRGRIYVLTPKHAKRLFLLLKKDLEEYEKKYGELKAGVPKKKAHTTALEKNSMGFTHNPKRARK